VCTVRAEWNELDIYSAFLGEVLRKGKYALSCRDSGAKLRVCILKIKGIANLSFLKVVLGRQRSFEDMLICCSDFLNLGYSTKRSKNSGHRISYKNLFLSAQN
jgi:hypothetical protein